MKIEENVTMPKTGAGRPNKYPFKDMTIGDSVFFAGETLGPKCRPYVAAQVWGRDNGVKFSGRTVDGGVRIWRTE